MRLLTTLLLLVVSVGAFAQMDMTPPAEIKQVSFMVGNFKGTEKFYSPDGTTMNLTSTVTAKVTLGGRFIQANHKSMMGKAVFIDGMEMLTYDPQAKVWRSYWFDNATSSAMKSEGVLAGGKMVMTGEPTEMPGAPEKVVFRSTYVKKSANQFTMLMEMKMGQTWTKFVEGTYTRTK